MVPGGRCLVGVSSVGANPGWTTEARGALQCRLDLDADGAGEIGGDDDAVGNSGVGTLASRVAERDVARRMQALSVRDDIQQCVTDRRYRM
jgi:hypothetical protein